MELKDNYILNLYNEARVLGLCKTQKEFADLLGMNPSTLSNAIQGKDGYLTDSILRRIQAWENQVLEPKRSGRPKEPERPDIIIPAATADLYNNMSETIRIQAELIARLQTGMAAAMPGAYAPKNFQTDGK